MGGRAFAVWRVLESFDEEIGRVLHLSAAQPFKRFAFVEGERTEWDRAHFAARRFFCLLHQTLLHQLRILPLNLSPVCVSMNALTSVASGLALRASTSTRHVL